MFKQKIKCYKNLSLTTLITKSIIIGHCLFFRQFFWQSMSTAAVAGKVKSAAKSPKTHRLPSQLRQLFFYFYFYFFFYLSAFFFLLRFLQFLERN